MKSDLFIECAKNVVDSYNLMQESIGSKNRMEYPVVKEVKPREWWEIMHRNNKVCPPCDNEQMYSNLRFDCYQSAKDFFSSHNIVEGFEVIKVREVTE